MRGHEVEIEAMVEWENTQISKRRFGFDGVVPESLNKRSVSYRKL